MTSLTLWQNKSLPDFGPTIPRSVPVLPVIATTLTPVFPKFIRIIEIHDPKMQKLILKNVAMKFPFAGLFVRKDDANPENVAKDPSEIYETGTFIHIQGKLNCYIYIFNNSILYFIIYFASKLLNVRKGMRNMRENVSLFN